MATKTASLLGEERAMGESTFQQQRDDLRQALFDLATAVDAAAHDPRGRTCSTQRAWAVLDGTVVKDVAAEADAMLAERSKEPE